MSDQRAEPISPATTTHSQLDADEPVTAGVTHDMVRPVVEIEHIDDILGDLDQAFARVAQAVSA